MQYLLNIKVQRMTKTKTKEYFYSNVPGQIKDFKVDAKLKNSWEIVKTGTG